MSKAKLSKELSENLAQVMKEVALFDGKGTVVVQVSVADKTKDIKFTIEVAPEGQY